MSVAFGYAGWMALANENTFGTAPSGTNEVQTITPNAAPGAGHITVSAFGIITGNIQYNDGASTIQTVFDTAFGSGNSTVTGDLSTAISVTWTGIYGNANVPQLTIATNTLSGGSYTTLTVNTGTPGAPPTAVFKYLLDETIEMKQSYKPQPVLGGTSQSHGVNSNVDVSGAMKFQMEFNDVERILYNLFGAVADGAHSGETTVYDHTFTRTNALPAGMTLWVDRDSADLTSGAGQFRYSGCQIDKLTLEQDNENMLIATVEFVGRSETLVYPIAKPTPHTFNQIDYLMQTSVTINGVTIPAKKTKIVFDNKLNKSRYVLGSNLRNGIQRAGVFECTATTTLEFQGTTQYLLFQNLTSFTAVLNWIGANVSGSVVPTPYKLAVTMNNCRMSGKTPNAKDWSVIEQEIDFMAFASTPSALDEVTAVLTNDVASMT